MPQMNKGGKFIFGKSLVRQGYVINFPLQAIEEYNITSEGKIIIFTGSKSTGGFCVTRKGLLQNSKIGNILSDNKELCDYTSDPCKFVKYKGRSYAWVNISDKGTIELTKDVCQFLGIDIGMKLLSIRSSDIAFTMGAKGPLLEKSYNYQGTIEEY